MLLSRGAAAFGEKRGHLLGCGNDGLLLQWAWTGHRASPKALIQNSTCLAFHNDAYSRFIIVKQAYILIKLCGNPGVPVPHSTSTAKTNVIYDGNVIYADASTTNEAVARGQTWRSEVTGGNGYAHCAWLNRDAARHLSAKRHLCGAGKLPPNAFQQGP
jgi:hypothetical protein